MGNEQTKRNNNIEIELNHDKLHTIKIINNPNKRYMSATFAVDKKYFEEWKTALEKARPHDKYLLIPFQYSFDSKELCGTSGSAQASYDSYTYLLLDQIQNRKAKKKGFDQTELWLLLYCLLAAQNQMRVGNKSRIGDVRPQNIFFNEYGQIKVANLLSWPKQTCNYQKFLENQPTYLAPQDMSLIEKSQVDNSENGQSEIFSIGLTILSAANLVDYKILYNVISRKFDYQQFNQIVEEWMLNKRYSDIFKATICSLIQIDSNLRIKEDILFTWIEKYREQILARNDFQIQDPPNLIIDQVKTIRKLYERTAINYLGINPISHYSLNSEFKKIGIPLEGERKLISEIKHPYIQSVPLTFAESVYKPLPNSVSNGYVNQAQSHFEYTSNSDSKQTQSGQGVTLNTQKQNHENR